MLFAYRVIHTYAHLQVSSYSNIFGMAAAMLEFHEILNANDSLKLILCMPRDFMLTG